MCMTDKLFYDFHLHSCLSPCGDKDMTPNNIINMAKLKKLGAIAITDHNVCGNCRAAMLAGARAGLTVIPGMELCSEDDIHIVCLFRTLAGALSFEKKVKSSMLQIKNRPDIFGEQLILDENDEVIGHEDILLIGSSGIATDAVLPLARFYGGTAFPAHADKTSNGIIAILGAIPPEAGFVTAELSSHCEKDDFLKNNPSLQNLLILKNSDAHYLCDISEPENFLPLSGALINDIIDYIDKATV